MGLGIIHQSVAASRIAVYQRLDAVTADALSSVVDDAATAARVGAVLAIADAVLVVELERRDGQACCCTNASTEPIYISAI